jgi:spore coat protein U-like protein
MGGQKSHRFSLAFLSGATLAVLAAQAPAQTVTIQLEGRIAVSCRLEASAMQLNLGEITQPGESVFSFRVRCNAPFRFGISSQNGALMTDPTGPLRAEFRSQVPYRVISRIPTSAGMINGSCNSAELVASEPQCTIPDSQQGIALDGESTLTIRWDMSEQTPVAGVYSDLLTLTVAPRI